MILQSELLFPLTGPGASLALGLEFVIIFVMIQFFLHFLIQYFRSIDKRRGGRNLAWAFLFLGFAGAYIIYIYTDHVLTDMAERDRVAIYAYLSLSIGGAIALILSEKVEQSKPRIFSLLSILMLGIIILGGFLNQRDLARAMAFVGAPLAVAYITLYLRLLLRISNHAREVKIPISEFFIGGIIIIVGYALNSDFTLGQFGVWIRVIGDLIVIVGLNLFMYGLKSLPDLGEFDWKQRIRALLIINRKDGVCLFSRFFNTTQEDSASREVLIAGALSSVQTVLKELSGKDTIESVQLSDKALIFDTHTSFIGVIIADAPFRSLQYRLLQFTREFEMIFQDILQNWDGNVNIFLPADVMADKIFMPSQSA